MNDGGGKGGTGGMCSADAGGSIPGDKDMHCIDSSGAEIIVVTSEAACSVLPASAANGDDAGVEEQAPTLYGSEGDDDDCKYHLKWTASCIEQNKNVMVNVTVTKKADGTPLTNAKPSLEVYLTDTHFAPNTKLTPPKETSPGSYTVGPTLFDAPGKWTMRFHLRETCLDTAESPHGHAAFYVNVP